MEIFFVLQRVACSSKWRDRLGIVKMRWQADNSPWQTEIRFGKLRNLSGKIKKFKRNNASIPFSGRLKWIGC